MILVLVADGLDDVVVVVELSASVGSYSGAEADLDVFESEDGEERLDHSTEPKRQEQLPLKPKLGLGNASDSTT